MTTAGLDGDTGAQPQRTMLSWHRTVLSVTLGTLVVSITAQRLEHPLIAAIAALTAFALLVLVLRSLRQWGPHARARWTVLQMTCISVVVLGSLGLLLALVNLFS
ncbi:DUF202 domain-containing protein [Ruania halotolerans]|uniref:DUF202 domain-containing protein n=1 Tax=Ruania halotolerans TaxID=2897773 RepID=UPI001E55A6FE|nr:DUF202 domain-containing protein [Ruania halotolerans]UFU05606.1 DUF202 domain-containing protein [Ruania halotolerans]